MAEQQQTQQQSQLQQQPTTQGQQQTTQQQQNQQPQPQQNHQPTQQQHVQQQQPSVQQQQQQQSAPQQQVPVQQQQQHQTQQNPTIAANSINPNAAAIMSVANTGMSSPNTMTQNPMVGNTIPANAMTLNTAALRNAIPQVQVIPQMHSPPYLPQFSYNQQQQFIMQNAAAMQAAALQANALNMNMNPQQINMANMNMAMAMRQGMGNINNAGLMSPSPATQTQAAGVAFSAIPTQVSTTNTQTTDGKTITLNKGQTTPVTPTQQAPATALIGGKPIMPTQGNIAGGPLVLGPLNVLSNQMANNQNFVAQSKGQAITVSLNQTGQQQLTSSQASIRFSQPQLVSSTGQIISSQPLMTNQAVLQAMANLQQQAIPLAHQPLFSAPGQSPTILSGQSLYIRTGNPVQGQQGMIATPGVQPVSAAVKGSQANIVKTNVPAVHISKQTAGQTVGKAILPFKAATARVNPTNIVGQKAKVVIPGAPKNPKGRPRTVNRTVGAMMASASTNTVASALSKAKIAGMQLSQSKPTTPTNQTLKTPTQNVSKSDSEVETNKKIPGADNSSKSSEKFMETKEKDNILDGREAKLSSSIEKSDSNDKKNTDSYDAPAMIEKQKAIVKPHILTHIIEGFVIQEGPEPFPVQRSSLLTEFIPPKPGQPVIEGQDIEECTEEDTAGPSAMSPTLPQHKDTNKEIQSFSKCEFCGNEQQAARFKRSKRFCTMACAKRYNVAHRLSVFKPKGRPGRPPGTGKGMLKKRAGILNFKKGWRAGRGGRLSYNTTNKTLDEEDMDDQQFDGDVQSTSNTSSNDSSSTPESPITLQTQQEMDMEPESHQTNPGKWSVTEVYEFIKSMPGCAPYAEEFKSQEIDGQALMLLKEDHLMTAMNMKLGPALKICAKINSMRSDIN